MDISATFRGLCKARKSLDKNISGTTVENSRSGVKVIKPEVSLFQRNAVDVLNLLVQARNYILARRKEYLEFDINGSETKRIEIETETLQQLQSCSERLSQLQKDVEHNRTQIRQHRSAVIGILKSYMSAVSKLLTDQQELRVKRALEHAKLSKLESFNTKKGRKPDVDSTAKRQRSDLSNGHAVMLEQEQYVQSSSTKEIFSADELQMFESENSHLYEELSGMENEIKRIENQMTEISKLQNIFTENVLMQEQQIDDVAATAVSTTENIKAGNIDIREAIQKTASFRAWILFVVLVLSFTLLFLDWYNE